MNTKHVTLGLVVLGCMGSLALAAACGSSDDASTSSGTGSGASCAPTDESCPALSVASDCLGLVDNTGKSKFVLRLSQLAVTAPTALTSPTVKKVVGDGVNVNLPTCNVPGKGTFSLITEFDLDKKVLRTGGAFPEVDPSKGYCFVDDPANKVAPVEVPITVDADLNFETDTIPKIVLPVFVDIDAASVVYLPLSDAKLSDGRISADRNCIGTFNASGLDPVNNCLPEPDAGIDFYLNGAALTGYITLEEADAVNVDLLGQSLCVLLSGDPGKYSDGGSPKRCKRVNGTIELQGDWCSTTNQAGGCKDSFRLAAQLAASSAALRSDCPGSAGSGGSGAGGAN